MRQQHLLNVRMLLDIAEMLEFVFLPVFGI